MNIGKQGYKYAIITICVLIIASFTEKDALARRYFLMNVPELEYKLSYEFEEELRTDQNIERKDRTSKFFEGFNLKTDGWVYHPALLEYKLTLSPEWEQQSTHSTVVGKIKSNTFLEGYYAELRFLQFKPYTFNMYAGKSTFRLSSNFAQRSTRNLDTYGATFLLKYPVLPSVFNYSHTRAVQAGFFAFDEDTDDLELQMNYNRYMGATRFRAAYKDTETTNQGVTTGLTEQKFDLNNKYGFNANRTLNSDLTYKTSEGSFTDLQRYSLSENFLWVHRKNLKTNYRFRMDVNEFATSRSETGSLTFNLTHLLYENLTTSINAVGTKSRSSGTNEGEYGGGVNFDYVRKIPWGTLTLNMGHSYMKNEVDRTDRIVEVNEESVILRTGTVSLLKNNNVDIDTIEVRNPVAPFNVYTENVDYTIEEMGSSIRIIRKAGGLITDGQEVYVDYEYLADPEYDYSTVTGSYGIALNLWKVWHIYYNLNQKDERFLSGIRPDDLIHDRIHSAGTGLTWNWSKTNLSYSDVDTTNLPKEEWNVEETLTFNPQRDLYLSFSGGYGEIRFKEREEVENFRKFSSTMQMLTSQKSRLTVEGFWQETSSPREKIVNSGISTVFELAYRILRGSLEYTYSNEENLLAQEVTTNHYVLMELKTKEF